MTMKYYSNGTTFEIQQKNGKYVITAYGKYIATADSLKEAYRICDAKGGESTGPKERLF